MKKILETLKQRWAEYLLEIFVITIGILGAYGLNNWNEDRKERILESKYLKRLQTDLDHDSIYFNIRISNARKYRADYAKGLRMAYETQDNIDELKLILSRSLCFITTAVKLRSRNYD